MPGSVYQLYQPYQPYQEQQRPSYAQATAEPEALPLSIPGPSEPGPLAPAPRTSPQLMEMDVGGIGDLRGRDLHRTRPVFYQVGGISLPMPKIP
jgi:hypothetical protein